MTGLPATSYDGPFFAYIHNIRDDNTWRTVIIFASRDVADDWWRAISTATTSGGLSLNVQRVAPQFYTHDPDQRWNVLNFFIDAQTKSISDLFRGKMFFTLDNDRGGRGISIIQLQTIIDNTSGNWFTIRSRSDPTKYWYYDGASGRIVVSDVHRTSFKISAVGLQDGTIMIGQDNITIYAENNGFVAALTLGQASGVEPLGVTGDGLGPANTFKLEDFKKGRFLSGLDDSDVVSYSSNGGPRAWELSM